MNRTGYLMRWSLYAKRFIIMALTIAILSFGATAATVDSRGPVQSPGLNVTANSDGVQAVGYKFANQTQKPTPWQAQWIWLNEEQFTGAARKPLVAQFRKEITLQSAPTLVRAWLSADVFYRLYVNGQLVSRGPADIGRDYDRGERGARWLYDARDLTPFFHVGRNVIAAEVFTQGFVGSRVTRHQNGLLFEAAVQQPRQPTLIVKSDATWQATPSAAWVAGGQFDATQESSGWRWPGFDAAAWPPCSVVESVWTPLAASELPPLMEARYPLSAVSQSTPNSNALEHVFRNGHGITLTGNESCTLSFNRVLAAYPSLQVRGSAGAVLKIIPGEHAGQSSRVMTLTLRDGEQEFEYPFLDSFSSLRIEAVNVRSPVEILDAGAVFSSFPVTYKGSFACSDPALSRLWQSSRWLTQICMQTHHLDSPNHQEPICDPGDYLIESVENYYAFGEPWLARQDLRKFGLLLRDLHYRNFHTSYSLLWLQMLMAYYDYTGDRALVVELAPIAHGLLDTFTSWRGKNGLISEAPNYMFMDWVDIGGFGAHHPPAVIGQGYMTAFYYRGLADGIRIAGLTSDAARVRQYESLRAATATAFEHELWNAGEGLYRDGKPFQTSVPPGQWLPADKDIETFSAQVNSLAVLYDLAPRQRQSDIMAKVMAARPLNCQPYFMYFVFAALDHSGLFERHAVTQMHRWQIVPETQTYHEMWNGGDLSHAWGGSPLIQMSSSILGVRPEAPGFKLISIRPQPSGLEWAKGTVPTPYGPVEVEWQHIGAQLRLSIKVPAGCAADVSLPTTGAANRVVRVNAGQHKFTAPFRPVVMAAPLSAPTAVGAVVTKRTGSVQSKTSGASPAAFEADVDKSDLINIGQATYLSATDEKASHSGGGTNADALRNGTTRNGAGGDDTADDGKTFRGYGDGDTVTFNLATSQHPHGYDINQIATFAGHADSRASQHYAVSIGFASDPTKFVTLVPAASVACNGGASEIKITNPAGGALTNGTAIKATGVVAVRFDFRGGSQERGLGLGFNVYREIDIIGQPTVR